MFNISGGKASTSKKHAKLSDSEIEALLKGYTPIQPEMWKNISIGTHIRYFKKNGMFVRGGFLISHWYNAGGLPCAHVSNNLRKDAAGYKAWPMDFAKVDKIYAKLTAPLSGTIILPDTPREVAHVALTPRDTSRDVAHGATTPRSEIELLKKKLGDVILHVNKLTAIVNEQKQKIDSIEKRI
jgi:hypothetical protein